MPHVLNGKCLFFITSLHLMIFSEVLQLLFGKYQADEQAWVDTIKSVGFGSTVRINTMDWLGQSQYSSETVYWSSLSSAVSEVGSFLVFFSFHFLARPVTDL